MNIYTAQYRYAGPDRLDITVKGNPNHVLAPTWEIVRPLQQGKLSQWDYAVKYFSIVAERLYYDGTKGGVLEMMFNHLKEVTLVCFCRPNEFCHRVLAARMLENMNFGKYLGERII